MSAYDPAAWSDFAVAVAGAAAALSGLLFVAVSINIGRILAYPRLPGRAGLTLILLITPLIVAVLVLVPGQRVGALAAELIAVAVLSGLPLGWLSRPATRTLEERGAGYVSARLVPSLAVVVLLAVAGATLAAGTGGGLYWIAPAVVIGFVAGLGNAWVLLVEILR